MNRPVVIYSSHYGFTERYARWIARDLDCPVFPAKPFPAQKLAGFDTVIFGGGLYAGGVSGIRQLIANRKALSSKKVILFTCGLADPFVPDNAAHIRASLEKTLPPEMMESIHFYHLRGGIDYSRLNFVHRSMMAMLQKMMKKKDPRTLGPEDLQLLETYGKRIDFTDPDSIKPLVEDART